MPGVTHGTGVDKLGTNIGIDGPDDDRRNNHKGKRSLLVRVRAETAKGRGGGVLAQVVETDRRRNNEQENRQRRKHGECFREVLRAAHLADKRREKNLRHPQERDVEYGVHRIDPRCALERESVRLDQAKVRIRVYLRVGAQRMVLNAREDHKKQDGNGHAEGRCHRHE